MHRLRGEFGAAEDAYRAAADAGREPQPGLALLRHEQGDDDSAAAGIRRALAEATDPLRRARLLPAAIRILIETGELDEAARACDELARIAETYASATLHAIVEQERGALALAAGDAAGALAPLRHALREWQRIDAPYESARIRVLLGRACRALGDEDAASFELGAARAVLERLGAAPDLARLNAHDRRHAGRDHGLTPRQREVLALLATGRTNREIATSLFISENTVARHVADIFRVLGVSTRAAATAYAYQNDLLQAST